MEEEWVTMEFIKAEPEGRLIHLFAREQETKRKHHYIIEDFYPYYYTKVPPTDDRVLWKETGFKNLFDEEVIKVVVDQPKTVAELRAPNDFEADVPYTHRFLIDTKIGDKFLLRKEALEKMKISVKDLRGLWNEEIGLRY